MATTGMDAEREFWIGLRSTYIQQIRLIRARFTATADELDGLVVGSIMDSLASAVLAIEKRFVLRHWQSGENRSGDGDRGGGGG